MPPQSADGSRMTPARAGPPPIEGRSKRTRSTRCQMPPGKYFSRLLRTNNGTTARSSGTGPSHPNTTRQATPFIRMLSQVSPKPEHQPPPALAHPGSAGPVEHSAEPEATPIRARLARVIHSFGDRHLPITSSSPLSLMNGAAAAAARNSATEQPVRRLIDSTSSASGFTVSRPSGRLTCLARSMPQGVSSHPLRRGSNQRP